MPTILTADEIKQRCTAMVETVTLFGRMAGFKPADLYRVIRMIDTIEEEMLCVLAKSKG